MYRGRCVGTCPLCASELVKLTKEINTKENSVVKISPEILQDINTFIDYCVTDYHLFPMELTEWPIECCELPEWQVRF